MTLICQITPEMLCKGSANALFDILRLKILRKWKYIFKNSPQQAPFRDAGTHKCYLCCYIGLLLEELALKVNAVSTVSPRLGKTNYLKKWHILVWSEKSASNKSIFYFIIDILTLKVKIIDSSRQPRHHFQPWTGGAALWNLSVWHRESERDSDLCPSALPASSLIWTAALWRRRGGGEVELSAEGVTEIAVSAGGRGHTSGLPSSSLFKLVRGARHRTWFSLPALLLVQFD